MKFQVRWMSRWDIPKMLEIEQLCFEFPWDEDQMRDTLKRRTVICAVAVSEERLAGFIIYQYAPRHFDLLNIAVMPCFQRKHCGQRMVNWLVNRSEVRRKQRLLAQVRETNLDAQLFLKQMGFRAIDIIPSPFQETEESAYLMEYLTDGKAILGKRWSNRVANLVQEAKNE